MKTHRLLTFSVTLVTLLIITNKGFSGVITKSSSGYSSFTFSGEVQIDENKSIEVFSVYNSYNGANVLVQIDSGSGWVDFIKQKMTPDMKFVLAGPCKIRLGAKGYYSSGTQVTNSSLFYRTLEEKEALSKKFATVIPENSDGNVSIILEQSTDLINWTAVNPGSFPPSTAKRFFRVRSQE
jgi:hypothetical protein